MKKKFLGLLCGLATLTVATSLIVAAIGKTNDRIFTNKESRPLNTFVIDEDTPVTSEDGDYYAVALSAGGVSINTKFVGFQKEDGKLVVKKNTRAVFLTVDPINVGFSGIGINFASGSHEEYQVSLAAYFSYFMLDINDITNGKYKDLACAVNLFQPTGNLNVELTDSDLSEMGNCRYVLGVIYPSEDLTLKEISYSTYCLAVVPEVDEIGYYNDWKASEKQYFINQINEVIPFVGSGSYRFYGGIQGAFLSEAKQNAYKSALISAGFDHYYSMTFGLSEMIYYQKKVADVVKTVGIQLLNDDLRMYTLDVTDTYAWIDTYNSWPSEYIAENLSSSFATFVNQNKYHIEGTGATYTCNAMVYSNERTVSFIVNGYSETPLEMCKNAAAVLSLIVSENADYRFEQTTPAVLPESGTINELYYSITNDLTTINVSYSIDSVFSVTYSEKLLSDTFPIDQINEQLHLESGDSVVPYTGTGQFYYYYGNLTVYGASVSDLNTYLAVLEAQGFTAELNDTYQYIVRGAIFEQYMIYISFEDLSSKGRFSMYYTGSDYGKEFDTFAEALEQFSESELVSNHEYPAISGEHKFKIVKYGSSSYRDGIYISGLGQGYLDELLEDGVYNPYFDAYVFSLEHEEEKYFALQAELVSGGVRVQPMTVYVDSSKTLYNSAEANELLRQGFAERYEYLESSDPDLYAAYLALRVALPDSNGDKVYRVDKSDLSFSIYGSDRDTYAASFTSALSSSGYLYSNFANKYSKYIANDEYGLVNAYENSENEYGVKFNSYEYRTEMNYQLVDFVSYATADLGSIEDDFADFPHSGDELMFVKPDDHTVIVSDAFDNDTFIANLEANGFESQTSDVYQKIVGNDLYTVSISDTYYDYPYEYYGGRGYTVYQFGVLLNYYKTYNAIIADAESYAPANFINALPAYNSADIAFADGGLFSNSITLEVKNGYSLNDFKDALVSKGYILNDGRYIYALGDYSIYCQINEEIGNPRIQFTYKEFNWTSYPTPAANLDNFYFTLHDLIPMPDESGNNYSFISGYDKNFSYYLKKSIDIEDYVDKFLALGYTIEDKSEYYIYLRYEDDPYYLSVAIEINLDCYKVSIDNFSNKMANTVGTNDIEAFFIAKGFSGVEILDVNVSFAYEEAYFNIDSDETGIDFYNVDSTDVDNLRSILEGDTSYNAAEWDSNVFIKETTNYRYEISIYDSYINIRVCRIYPEP